MLQHLQEIYMEHPLHLTTPQIKTYRIISPGKDAYKSFPIRVLLETDDENEVFHWTKEHPYYIDKNDVYKNGEYLCNLCMFSTKVNQ